MNKMNYNEKKQKLAKRIIIDGIIFSYLRLFLAIPHFVNEYGFNRTETGIEYKLEEKKAEELNLLKGRFLDLERIKAERKKSKNKIKELENSIEFVEYKNADAILRPLATLSLLYTIAISLSGMLAFASMRKYFNEQ